MRGFALVAVFNLAVVPAFAGLVLPEEVIAEATGPTGAIVTYDVSVDTAGTTDDGRSTVTVTCTPASFSLFPLGTTIVSCSGSDGSNGTFPVTVVDTTGPVLLLPGDLGIVSTDPAVVTFDVRATDLVDGSVPVTCSPASGSIFPLGTTTVSCSATDTRQNSTLGSFDVTLAASPPPPGPNPFDITAEASGPDGATVTFRAGLGQDEDGRIGVGCTPASNSLFSLGTTQVQCPSASFTVTVVDTTPPALSLPDQVFAISTDPIAVSYVVSATDLVDGVVPVTCSPLSGSIFQPGTTTVTCSASDARGNLANGNFDVKVVPSPPPPPGNPADIVAEASGPDGAVVGFVKADLDGRPIPCTPPSGSTFPLGVTNVNCQDGTTFTITVVDTTPPELTLPGDFAEEATGPDGAVVSFGSSATDLVDGIVPVTCAPPSSSLFPLGATTVQCSATDTHGNTASDSFVITIRDTTPPVVVSIAASPNNLWPPNHKWVDVQVTIVATDIVDPAPASSITAVQSNQPIDGLGDGDTSPDWEITGPLSLRLRAESAQGQVRMYTIFIHTADAAGNATFSTAEVTVASPSRVHAVH